MMLSLSMEKLALAGRGKLTRQAVTKKTTKVTDNEEMSDAFNFFLSKVNLIRHVKSIIWQNCFRVFTFILYQKEEAI